MYYIVNITIKTASNVSKTQKLTVRPHNITNSGRIQQPLTIEDKTFNFHLQIDNPAPSTINGILVLIDLAAGASVSYKLIEKMISTKVTTATEWPAFDLPSNIGKIIINITTVID